MIFCIKKKISGFTLIELLVVVAIISILASIVLASLSSARNRSKDSAIKEEVSQFTNLLTLNYNDYGDYCNLQANWNNNNATCSASFSGAYATNARNICNTIYNNASDAWSPGGAYKIYTNTSIGCATAYSIMVFLNDGKWYCAGSSGRKGEYAGYSGLSNPGCYDNP